MSEHGSLILGFIVMFVLGGLFGYVVRDASAPVQTSKEDHDE